MTANEIGLAASNALYDLISMLDLPDEPACQGDVDDCPCHGCRLYDEIVDVIKQAKGR